MRDTADKKPRLFLDTNILLDYLADREIFSRAAEMIIDASLDGLVELAIAPHSLTNIFYITRKDFTGEGRLQITKNLCALCHVHPITGELIERAIAAEYTDDFEDALQIRCAVESNSDCIITRDSHHFDNCPIETLTPSEAIVKYSL